MATSSQHVQPGAALASEHHEPRGRDAKSLAERYEAVRRFSHYLCEPLEIEDYVVQSIPDASPVKWHLAHTTWFFETFILKKFEPGYESFHPQFEYLFNSYYNAVGPQFSRPHRGNLSRPTVGEVYEYRQSVDDAMHRLLEKRSGDQRGDLDELIEIGLNHEQQHQELIVTDLKHMLSCNPLRPVYRTPVKESEARFPPMQWRRFSEGVYEIGHEGPGFCFDNETPRHRVFLESFELASRPVTCGEYIAFIENGGYEAPEYWLSDGWATINSQGWQMPMYWEKHDGQYWMYTLGGFRPVCEEEPVCHISHYEADAYATWAGARLPTEAEWEIAAAKVPIEGNLAEHAHFHPLPAASQHGAFCQLFGDVWEWTRSPYIAYPGYKPLPGALGEYNGKFMSNQMVLRGGSCATPASHIRPAYRNFFPPQARWQFMGMRLARDV